MTSPSRTAKRTLAVETALELLAGACGLLCFLMVQDAIGWGTALIFGAALLIWPLAEALGLPRPPGLLSFGIAVPLLVAIFSRMSRQYLAEPFLEAILLLFVLRLFERKTSREYVQIALLSLGAVVVYALLSVEKLFLVICLGMGYCASLILMLSAWMRREPGARLSFSDAKRLVFRALGMFVVMLPLCLLIFFVIPRSGHPMYSPRGGTDRSVLTGFSEKLRLGEVGTIQQSDRLSFRAETEEIAPGSLYWRGAVLSYFSGAGWDVDLREREGGWGRPRGDVSQVRQTILLEPGGHRWLFALDRPLSIGLSEAANLGNGTFWRRMAGTAVRYEAVSTPSPIPGTLSASAEEVFLELPSGYSPAMRSLAEKLTAGISDDRGRMNVIEDHFIRGGYLWSLENLVRGRDALERFVFDVRRGNCEYFASAAAVMLRMANVPARLVGGYRGGDYNRAGGYYSVRDRQAHVWVEAWDRSAGCWVRIDPTPAGEADGEGTSEDTGGWWEFWDFLDYQWSRMFVSYSARTQSEWASVLKELLSNPRASLRVSPEGLLWWGRLGLGFVVLLAVVSFLVLVRKRRRRDPCRALLERFERMMKRRGFPRRRSEGLEEFVSCLDEPLQGTAWLFVLEFEEVWYGGRPLDPERYGRLKRRLDKMDREH